MRMEPITHLLLLATTKHSTTNDIIYYKRDTTRIIRKGKHSNASSFHSNPIHKCTIHLQAQNFKDLTSKIGSTHTGGLPCLREKLESVKLHEVVPQSPLQWPSPWAKSLHGNGSYLR
jgi:hypothetical protein